MNELSSNQPEKLKTLALNELSFAELEMHSKEVSSLGKTTFKETENGFQNIYGDIITIGNMDGTWQILEISNDLRDFHRAALKGGKNILDKGSKNKDDLIQAIKDMMIQFGNRIIE